MSDDFGLTDEIKNLRQAVEVSNRRSTWWYGFVHGIFVGLGTSLGVVVILGFFGFILREVIAPHLPAAQEKINDVLGVLDSLRQTER